MSYTIQLKGQPIRKEGVASEAMSPGHFVVSAPTDESAAGSLAFPAAATNVAQGVVLENDIEGGTITTAYATNDNVLYGVFPRGAEVLGRVAASATAIAKGVALAVQADGTLLHATVGTHQVVAVALEAIDNSGGGAEVFIKVEIA